MIYKSDHTDNFTQLDNDLINSNVLSGDAFRLLVFMLSRPDGWKFSIKGLAYNLETSERTISDRLGELKKAGYIHKRNLIDEHGRFTGCEWDVYEKPLTVSQENRNAEEPQRGKTATRSDRNAVKPTRGKTDTRKLASINNTNISKTDISKTDISKTKESNKRFTPPTVEQVRAYCLKRNNNVDAERFVSYYTSNGWKVGRTKMQDWEAAVRTWERSSKPVTHCQPKAQPDPVIDWDELYKRAEEADRRKGNT